MPPLAGAAGGPRSRRNLPTFPTGSPWAGPLVASDLTIEEPFGASDGGRSRLPGCLRESTPVRSGRRVGGRAQGLASCTRVTPHGRQAVVLHGRVRAARAPAGSVGSATGCAGGTAAGAQTDRSPDASRRGLAPAAGVPASCVRAGSRPTDRRAPGGKAQPHTHLLGCLACSARSRTRPVAGVPDPAGRKAAHGRVPVRADLSGSAGGSTGTIARPVAGVSRPARRQASNPRVRLDGRVGRGLTPRGSTGVLSGVVLGPPGATDRDATHAHARADRLECVSDATGPVPGSVAGVARGADSHATGGGAAASRGPTGGLPSSVGRVPGCADGHTRALPAVASFSVPGQAHAGGRAAGVLVDGHVVGSAIVLGRARGCGCKQSQQERQPQDPHGAHRAVGTGGSHARLSWPQGPPAGSPRRPRCTSRPGGQTARPSATPGP